MKKPMVIAVLPIGGAALKIALSVAFAVKDGKNEKGIGK